MADRPMVSTTVGDGGRIVIPASYRKVLGLRKGSQVLLSLRDSEIRLLSLEAARKRARDFVRSLVPSGVSLADELIRERREKAKRE
jgi:AbrB family looped-hinge helix DNA binding protein